MTLEEIEKLIEPLKGWNEEINKKIGKNCKKCSNDIFGEDIFYSFYIPYIICSKCETINFISIEII